MNPAGTPRISLVIPAHNEERLLPRLLDTIDVARRRFSHGAQAVEVIVANNASTDKTAELARARGCMVVDVEPRIIAAVRNAGAREAGGEILAFVDADMQIHPETFNAIDSAIASGRFVGGATGVVMERWSLGLALTWAVMIPMVWVTGYDTGVVFVRRADFETLGGYDEKRRYAEDVGLMLAMHRLGRTRGQKIARLRRAKAITSVRKFDEHGHWHYFHFFALASLWMLGYSRPLDRYAATYWYSDHR